jgi:hypothetical protein
MMHPVCYEAAMLFPFSRPIQGEHGDKVIVFALRDTLHIHVKIDSSGLFERSFKSMVSTPEKVYPGSNTCPIGR